MVGFAGPLRAAARRHWARSPAARVLALLAVAVLLASCGSACPRAAVALLPATGADPHSWQWTGQCPLSPAAAEGCARAGPILGDAQLNGDEWNLGGAADAGALDMSVGSGGAVSIQGRFARTAPCTAAACLAPSAYTWVRGYPNVLYGINQCYASTSPPQSPRLRFPMRLDSIPSPLVGVTSYSAQTSQVTYDIAYDLWLHQTGTTQPCRSQGTLEIMVWTDYAARALLPASLQVGTVAIPYALNGVTRPGTQAWAIYASNIDQDGRTASWGGTLWFVPSQAGTVSHGRSASTSVRCSPRRPAPAEQLRLARSGPALLARHGVLRRRVRPGERRSDGLRSGEFLRPDLRLLPRRAQHADRRRVQLASAAATAWP